MYECKMSDECKCINKKLIRHITQEKETFSSDSDEKSLFIFFNQLFQKFQKRDKVFLCKLFSFSSLSLYSEL